MLKIFKNVYFFKVAKTNTKKESLEKPKKENLLLIIPENINDGKLSVCKTIYQLNIGIRCFKN